MMDQGKATGSPTAEKVTPAPTLPHVVECKSFSNFFEPIAAFNCIEAAQHYKAECAKVNRAFQYRTNSHYEG